MSDEKRTFNKCTTTSITYYNPQIIFQILTINTYESEIRLRSTILPKMGSFLKVI